MKKKEVKQLKTFSIVVSILFVIVSIALALILLKPSIESLLEQDKETKDSPIIATYDFEVLEGKSFASINIPAVDKEGNGVLTQLIVKAEPGTGKTLVDIDSLLFWVDTQNSIRIAKLVAKEITMMDLDKYDLTFKVNANATLIGGESAGTALALATIAALQNKTLRSDIMITGTMNHDGTIGPVGGILGKAKAARDVGATKLLVPLLQSREVVYETREHCETLGFTEFCWAEQTPKIINVHQETGVELIEVGSIQEAIVYFY